jgi:hypothetical protein
MTAAAGVVEEMTVADRVSAVNAATTIWKLSYAFSTSETACASIGAETKRPPRIATLSNK